MEVQCKLLAVYPLATSSLHQLLHLRASCSIACPQSMLNTPAAKMYCNLTDSTSADDEYRESEQEDLLQPT